MKVPNKKQIFSQGERTLYFYREYYALFRQPYEYGKNANSAGWLRVFPYQFVFCLATIGVCVFRCADFGWRTFLFYRKTICKKGEKKMIKKSLCTLLLIAIFLGSISFASCAKKTPYEMLIEYRESYYDTNGEWSALYSKYSKPIDKQKRQEITEERNAKEKKLREELGLNGNDTLQEFKENCKLSEEDIKRYIDTYSFADFYSLNLSDGMILWLMEIYSDAFVVFDFNNKPETVVGTYYYENPDPKPVSRTEPPPYIQPHTDPPPNSTYTVTYHGDFAVEVAVVHQWQDGKLGFAEGGWFETGYYYVRESTKLYYKGELIDTVKIYHPTHSNMENLDYTDSLRYIYTFETPSTIEKGGLNTYSGIYIWYDHGDMNRTPWGIIN